MQFGVIGSLIIYLIPPALLILNYKLNSKYIRYGFFIYIFLLLALNYNVPTDYQRYCNMVELTNTLKFTLTNEPLQQLILYIANRTDMIRLFFVINAFLVTLCSYLFYKQYQDRKYKDLMLFLYYFAVILISYAAVRNGLAIGISMLSIKYLLETKKYSKTKFTLLVLLASMSHTSALIMFVLPILLFIYNLSKKYFKNPLFIVSPIIIAALPFVIELFKYLSKTHWILPKYYHYLAYFSFESVNELWISLGVLIVILGLGFDRVLNHEKENEEFKLSILAAWTAMMALFLLQGPLVRISIWFFPFAIFAMARLFELEDKRNKIFIALFSLFIVIALSYVGIFGPVKAFPYNTSNDVIWHSNHDPDFRIDVGD